jgi:integrase/recombinase XerD
MLLLFIDTGARRGGVANMTLTNLNLLQRRAVVTEKGNKKRTVYFSFYTAQHLQKWFEVRESESDALFINIRSGHPLTLTGINQVFKRLKKMSGVKETLSPQTMRSGFARQYIKQGGDISVLAKLLGHENINTTASYYAIFDEDEMAEFHDKVDVMGMMLGKSQGEGKP